MTKRIMLAAAICALVLAGCAAEDSSEKNADSSETVSSAAESVEESAADNSEGEESAATGSESDTSSEASSDDSGEKLTSSLEELKNKLLEADPDLLNGYAIYGDNLFRLNCKRLYRCKLEDLADGLIVYNDAGGKADEVSIIKRADGDEDKAESSLLDRIPIRHTDFKGYVPEELPKIDAGVTFTSGDWAVLIISDKAGELEKLIKDNLPE